MSAQTGTVKDAEYRSISVEISPKNKKSKARVSRITESTI